MRTIHRDEKVRQPSLSRLYPAVSYTTAHNHEAHALDVAIQILGGSETSRLYRALVEDQRIAVSAGASANTDGIGGGSVSIGATPTEGVTLQQLEVAMDQVIARFLRDGPTEAELTRAKSQLAAAAIYAQDSQEALANMYGSGLVRGESMDEIVNWPDDIQAVTRDQVLTAARNAVVLDNSVTGWLMPPETAQ